MARVLHGRGLLIGTEKQRSKFPGTCTLRENVLRSYLLLSFCESNHQVSPVPALGSGVLFLWLVGTAAENKQGHRARSPPRRCVSFWRSTGPWFHLPPLQEQTSHSKSPSLCSCFPAGRSLHRECRKQDRGHRVQWHAKRVQR